MNTETRRDALTYEITRDTRLCISLAARPGNFGNRFHNFLFRELGLDFIYKSFSTDALGDAMLGIRALGIRGSAISMPFKEGVIALLDDMDAEASEIGAVNTVVNTEGHLKGYNTDLAAVRELVGRAGMPSDARVALLGSGGMAKAMARALCDLGFRNTVIIARNTLTGHALAARYGFEWSAQPQTGQRYEAILNATSVGMAPSPPTELPIVREFVSGARFVLDAVASPAETALIGLARELGKATATGFEITVRQAVEQFALYTGVRPLPAQVERAAAHASAAVTR